MSRYFNFQIVKKTLIGLFLMLFSSFAQLTISSNMTSEVTVNGSNGNYQFSITNISGATITDVSMDIDVPQGMKYIDGSMVPTH